MCPRVGSPESVHRAYSQALPTPPAATLSAFRPDQVCHFSVIGGHGPSRHPGANVQAPVELAERWLTRGQTRSNSVAKLQAGLATLGSNSTKSGRTWPTSATACMDLRKEDWHRQILAEAGPVSTKLEPTSTGFGPNFTTLAPEWPDCLTSTKAKRFHRMRIPFWAGIAQICGGV